jgi:hypothetical protein
MQPKTRVISTPVLLGLSVLCCLVLYQFADLTPANSPLPAWVISSMAEARSTGRPEGPVPVAAGVASQTAPALEPPTISRPSPDLTAMPSKEATTGAAETNGAAQSAPALLSPAAPAVSSDIASPEPEQARLARIEADRQAAAEKKAAAEREAQVEDRLQGARLQEAQRASAGFEAERLAVERRRALQAASEAAAAKQAQLARIEADRQAAAEKKAAAEREAQVEDRLQGARLREAERASAGFELARRAEAERVAAERRRALQAASEAAAAEQAKLAQIEADRQGAAAEREAQVEDRLQGARLREAQRASAGFEVERRAEAEQTTTGSISRSDARSEIRMAGRSAADDERGQFKRLSDGRNAAKNVQPGSNEFAGLGGSAKRIRRTIAPSADLDRKGVPRAGDRQRSASEGDDQGAFSGAAPSVVATLSESGGPRSRRILQHRCASILQDSDEYDDDLVSLCRTWGAGGRATAR